MSGLLGNLITQVARSALDPNDAQRNPLTNVSTLVVQVDLVTYWQCTRRW